MSQWMPEPAEEPESVDEEVESPSVPEAEDEDLLITGDDDEFQD